MKKTHITAFYNDALILIFNACVPATQKAIAATSSQWHQVMFKIREKKASEALKLLGPMDTVDPEKVSFQQQYYEKKLALLDQRAKRLADWFTSSPPNPKYTGKINSITGEVQLFRKYAATDLEQNVFQDDLFFVHSIIDRAIEKYGFSHAATSPLDKTDTNLSELLMNSNMHQVSMCYTDRYQDEIKKMYFDQYDME